MTVDLHQTAIKIAHEEGVPADIFLSLVAHESGWRTNARSRAGARGLTQLMPATARSLGVNPDDPIQNLRGGARYLRQQLDKFGNIRLALAAYNAGPGAVSSGKWERYPETIAYVSGILNSTRHAYTRLRETAPPSAGHPPAADLTTPSPLAAAPAATAPADPFGGDPIAKQAFEGLGKIGQGWSPTSTLSDLVDVAATTPPQAPEAVPVAPVSSQTPSQPVAPSPAPSPQGHGVVIKGAGGWDGSQGVVSELTRLAPGLKVTSEKRDRRYTTSGNTSDHYSGNRAAFARDISNGYATPQMDAAAQSIARALGVSWSPKDGPLEISKVVNGYRIQVLYRTHTGGNHFTHIHVGARRVG